MTPNEGQQLLAGQARLEEKIDNLTVDVVEVKQQAKLTNGRVTELERAEIRRQTIWRIIRWCAGIGSPIVTAALIALSNADKL